MWGPSLALMSRALRVDSRLLRMHLFRAIFATIIFFSMAIAHLTSMMRGAPGLHFFSSITWLNFVFITMAGLSYFATAITEEKDESMLGLLRMAGIGPLSLMLGKSTTRLATALLVLSVQFPFTFLAITLGGVTIDQVIAVYVSLVAYLFFLANLGLFCSIYARGSARAAALMTLLVILFLAVVPITHSMLNDMVAQGTLLAKEDALKQLVSVVDWLWHASIIYQLNEILETSFNESPFSVQVISHLVGAVALFALSWLTFDYLTDERSTALTWRDRLQPASWRTGRRKPMHVWKNPFLWKDFYFAAGGHKALIAKFFGFILIAGVYLWIILSSTAFTQGAREDYSNFLMGMAVAVSAVELSIYSANLFREEVRSHTLSTLMLLPVSTIRIVVSKVLCMVPALIPAVLVFLIGCAFDHDGMLVKLWKVFTDPAVWMSLAGFVLFLHVTAWFSLIVKWGALPLALFAMYFAHACLFFPLVALFTLVQHATGNSGLYALPYVFICLGSCVAVEFLIANRLEEVAKV